jgi:hypothetical protein
MVFSITYVVMILKIMPFFIPFEVQIPNGFQIPHFEGSWLCWRLTTGMANNQIGDFYFQNSFWIVDHQF